MAAEYQEPDWRVVDYEPFCLDPAIIDVSRNCPLRIRGPRPASLDPGEYFVALGAAQTFGRFCERPFPTLLQERLGLPALNISHGGAGPSFFSGADARLFDYLNSARFVVLQVMSGRSAGNSLYESHGVGHYTRRSDGVRMDADQAFAELIQNHPREVVQRVVEETRADWVASYRSILARVSAPVILFWFSSRRPNYRPSFDSVRGLLGDFPQLVNAAMLKTLRGPGVGFASCVTSRGLPQPLIDRFTGEQVVIEDPWTSEPWRVNWYYPSPQMHVQAADALENVCRRAAGIPARRPWFARRSTGADASGLHARAAEVG